MQTFVKTLSCLALFLTGGCLDLEQDYVAVVGVGEARQFPDYASMSVEVIGSGETAGEATASLNEKVAELQKVAVEFELNDDDVQSRYFDIERQTRSVTRPDGSRYSEPAGFDAVQYLNFRTAELERAGELLGALLAAGAEGANGPVYLIEDESELFENARKLAIEDAKRRAEAYASSVGKALGEVEIVEESGTESQRMDFQLRDRLVESYRQEEQGSGMISANSPRMMAPRQAVYSKPEEIAVTVSIYVKYKLE